MKQAYGKNIIRTIKKSMGRYVAIFAIIALGVGFLTGLKASRPDMMLTAQKYLKEQKMYDNRLISTWGFSEEEVEDMKQLSGVAAAEGAVWEDFLTEDESGREMAVRAMSVTDTVNTLKVVAGRMPQKADECVLDADRYGEEMIGKKLQIATTNSRETKESFAYDSYRVVGLVRTPLYLNRERGTTTIGNGKLNSFVYLLLEGFSYTYFEEVYVKSTVDDAAFTEAYDTRQELCSEALETQVAAVIHERYQQEIDDAQKEINDAEKELDDSLSEAEEELEEAKEKLTNGEQQLSEAKEELERSRQELSRREQELLTGEQTLKDGEAAYQQGLAEYQSGVSEYAKGQEEYQTGTEEYERNLAEYQAYREMLGDSISEHEQELAAMEEALSQAKGQLDQTAEMLSATGARLEQAEAELEQSSAQLAESRERIENGKQQINQAKEALAENENALEEKQKELEEGREEYESGLAKLSEEEENARQEIADAKKELEQISKPELYVLDRGTNIGYACYESDISIVEGIARVFPVFFFLIAALVCSTTMTRMVDDERTQIGTLRAMGYTSGAIFLKYAIYSGSAAGLGATIGYLVGVRAFPHAIWAAYNMLYGFADLTIADNPILFLIALLLALICSVGTTYASCRMALSHMPADLIRPKAPLAGKRIFLERITPLWKRMKFLHKVSARNIFRYKKRMILMILGIAGCTALILTGFGLKDSVSNVVNVQYDEILQYEISVTYRSRVTEKMLTEIREQFPEKINGVSVAMETSADALGDDGVKAVTILVSDSEESRSESNAESVITNCVNFHGSDDKESLELPGKGEILIDNRLAREFSLKVGDTIELQVEGKTIPSLTVSGIFENYVNYYAYVSSDTYGEFFGESFEPKTIYVSLEEDTDPYQISSYLSDMEDAASVSVTADMRNRIQNIMQSMNDIVALVIGCAAALAFIVLFNLGNINISERVREIATLKVLGFYPKETGSYVFRESVVLSLMGIVVGIPLGVLLHSYVMSQIQVDMVSFQVQILPLSYVYSVVSVLVFTLCVDLILRRKISKIQMAESLKSIE